MVQSSDRRVHGQFEDLAGAVTDYGTETAGRTDGVGQKGRSGGSGSAAFAALISLVALVFSGFSFYETVLRAPELRIYAPPQVHLFREGFRDVFAVPITLSNDGARRGTVLAYDLTVTHRETGETMGFQSLNFGASPKADDKAMFTPITVAGRSSDTHLVLFAALQTGSFVETTGGVQLPLSFELRPQIDQTGGLFAPKPVAPIRFDMTATYIEGFPGMEQGRPTPLYSADWVAARTQSASE